MEPVPSDETLMRAVARADLSAFEPLVLRHQESAWRTAYRMVGCRQAAEDIAQEAFVRVFQAADRYQPTAPFRTYFYRILVRLCLDHLRRRHPVPTAELIQVPDPSASALELAMRCERVRAVENALSHLPPRQRAATVLRYYEGLSGREIAAAMGTSVKAVERLLARARAGLERLLRDFLED
jgi:RNA polymerase sigma-70 factor (ECF subfamily)